MSVCLDSRLWTCLRPQGPSGSSVMSSWVATWLSSTVATGKAALEWVWPALDLEDQDSEGESLRRRIPSVEALVQRMRTP